MATRRQFKVTSGTGSVSLPQDINRLQALSASRLNQSHKNGTYDDIHPSENVGNNEQPRALMPDYRHQVSDLGNVQIGDAQPDNEQANIQNELHRPSPENAPPFFGNNFPLETPEPKNEQIEHRVNRPLQELGEFTQRTILPSGGIFYDFNDIAIRPITTAELAKMHKAVETKDIVLFNDVLDATVNVDIRDLWLLDVRYIMIWHKINSFVRMPYNTTWTSIYGNKNRTRVDMTDIVVNPVKMSREKYAQYRAKGLTAPLLRDQEHYESFSDDLPQDDIFLYERAMFLSGGNLHERKKTLEKTGLDILFDIKEFRDELNLAEVEIKAKVKDQHFDYKNALTRLNDDLSGINDILANETDIPESLETLMDERKTKIENELLRLTNTNPGEAEPLLETIPLNISVFDFFPDL